MIINTIRETRNTTAKAMVIRSRFFSIRPVPVLVLYRELEMTSEIPVPLPEWRMMNAIRPMPDATSRIRKTITKAVNLISF